VAAPEIRDPSRINAQFLETLKGRESVGVDKNGRLYIVTGWLSSATFAVASGAFHRGLHEKVSML
jgi:hypothetical protein